MRRLQNIIIPPLISLGAFLVLFFALEIGLRLYSGLVSPSSKSGAAYQFNRERPQQYVLPNDSNNMRGNSLGHPKFSPDDADRDGTSNSNELSTPAADRGLSAKRPGEYRIAIVGDSFTFAPGMQFFSTFSKQLETILQLKSDVTVLNLGSPGFSTTHELEVFKKAFELNPDLILLQVTLNDPQEHPLQEEPAEIRGAFGPYVPGNFFTRHSRVLSWVAARLHNTASVQAYIHYHQSLWDTQFSRFEQPVREMAALAHDKGIGFGVVLFPLFDFPLNDASYPFIAEHEKISHLIQSLHVPILDLYPEYRGLDPYRLQLIPGKDSHPNEIAHRIAAERIYWWLRGRSFFPPERKLNRLYPRRDNLKEMQFSEHERRRNSQK